MILIDKKGFKEDTIKNNKPGLTTQANITLIGGLIETIPGTIALAEREKVTREQLEQLFEINKEIEMWKHELYKLRNKSTILGQQITDMPHASGCSDKVATTATENVEVEQIIINLENSARIERERLMNYIAEEPDSLMRQIFYLHNVQNYKWGKVADMVGNSEDSVKKIYYRYFDKEVKEVN